MYTLLATYGFLIFCFIIGSFKPVMPYFNFFLIILFKEKKKITTILYGLDHHLKKSLPVEELLCAVNMLDEF